jgi:Xaa-Pro aminopeptidase
VAFTSQEYSERLNKLQQYLSAKEIDLAVLNYNSELYYYTGSTQPLYLLVPAEGEPLMLARKAVEQIRREVPHMRLEVFYGTKELLAILESLGLGPGKALRAGYTLDVTSYATVSRFQQLLGQPEIVDLSWDIRVLRVVKSEAEIAIQTRAGEIISKVPQLVKDNFRPGMTEIEMSVALEDHFRLSGHTGIIRCRREGIDLSGLGVCSSGINMLAGSKFDGICTGTGLSPAAPYGAGSDEIKQGTPVILDFALNIEGYHVDQTRMFSFGEPPVEVLNAYKAMVTVEQRIIEDLVPGKSWEEVYDNAVNLASELGYEKEFMGLGSEKVRFVGHGVGVELDEPPYLAPKMSYPLQEGMVIAIEPKVSLPGLGVIGPEDTLVIRKDGPVRLTLADDGFLIV